MVPKFTLPEDRLDAKRARASVAAPNGVTGALGAKVKRGISADGVPVDGVISIPRTGVRTAVGFVDDPIDSTGALIHRKPTLGTTRGHDVPRTGQLKNAV